MNGFSRNERGAVALITAILLIPLVLVAAGGIDYGRAVQARQQLQAALDDTAAVLAGSDNRHGPAAALLTGHVRARMGDRAAGDIGDVIVADRRGAVEVRARLRVQTPILALIGVPDLWVGAAARARHSD
jgi:Flp pilus assembly protein TadG